MNLKVLGASGAEFPNFRSPAYLLDESLLLDAGTIGSVLVDREQWNIRNILLSHCHLDHIKGLPFLADNIVISGRNDQVNLIGTADVLHAVGKHLFNNVIWPDFFSLPSQENAALRYVEIRTDTEVAVDGYSITAIPVDHSVPSVGYLVKKEGSALLYTGDTGPTERIWQYANSISVLIVEVSFPNHMQDMALLTGHLTPLLLTTELRKLVSLPPLILITHPKPQFRDQILLELQQLRFPGIQLMNDGDEYSV